MGAIISRLLGPVASGTAAILLVLLVTSRCTIASLESDLREERAAREKVISDLATCRGSVATLRGSLDAQSEAVAAAKAAGDLATKKAEEAAREALEASASAEARATALLNRATPQGDVCGAALDLLRGSLP